MTNPPKRLWLYGCDPEKLEELKRFPFYWFSLGLLSKKPKKNMYIQQVNKKRSLVLFFFFCLFGDEEWIQDVRWGEKKGYTKEK